VTGRREDPGVETGIEAGTGAGADASAAAATAPTRPTSLRSADRGGRNGRAREIPEATVARLPLYLRALRSLADSGVDTVSSDELAAAAGVGSAKLRKDLSYLGSYGTRGVGYDVDYLVYQVSRELGLTQDWPVVIVGVGNLGHALANYGGFATRGFQVHALLDSDARLTGQDVAGVRVQHVDELESVLADALPCIGVIATPASAAQEVCDRMVEAGVRSILNFAPVVLAVPADVDVRKVDLSIELQILAFHEQRKSTEQPGQQAGQHRPDELAPRRLSAARG
jgi:redox-sensing transcriptional repressor